MKKAMMPKRATKKAITPKRAGKAKPKLGSGKRFSNLVNSMEKEGKSEKAAKAIAASIGRKKYGDKKMEKMAEKGMKKAAKKK